MQINPDQDNGMILTQLLAKHKTLNNAWLRGRFLRNLRNLAAVGADHAEAADRLGMDGAAALGDLLAGDREAEDIWPQSKKDALIKLKASLMKSAMDGNQAAIKAMQDVIKSEQVKQAGDADFRRVTHKQMIELLGRHKTTLHYWRTSCGLPTNEDGTYDLSIFLAWYRNYFEGKATRKTTADAGLELDPLKRAKAQRLEIEISKHRSQLLDRDEVIGGLLARHQILISWANHRPDDLGRLCQGQKAERITKIIKKAIDELRKNLCNVPAELQLPTKAEKQLQKLLKGLG